MIRLQAVTKQFPVAGKGRLRPRRLRTVLDRVDLVVRQGESVAILGENGAGKSTLMKIIAGIQRPTTGTVEVDGRLGAMIELGAGFHPEQSAVPNLRAAATLMGVLPRDLSATVEAALDFSGLDDHVDKPLKHYSSGMVVRLAFALITAARPDLLISDEVLAVGDETFQKKCIAWLEGYLEQGGTLLLVSHNLYHAQKLCSRGVWLHHGRIAAEGDVFDTVQTYLGYHDQKSAQRRDPATDDETRLQITVENARGDAVDTLGMGEPLFLRLQGGDDRMLRVLLSRMSGERIWTQMTQLLAADTRLPLPVQSLLPGRYVVEIADPQHPGRPGRHRVFRVDGRSREFGSVRLDHQWI